MKRIVSYLLVLAIILSCCFGIFVQVAATTAGEPVSNTKTLSVAAQPQNSSFEVHFIDVGQADAALILCDGKAMLIDGGNVADSSTLYTYLQKHNVSRLDYVIGTHAHEDHIGGIPGALNYASAGIVYCPVTTFTTTAFSNFVKAVQKQGLSITVPSRGTTFSLGSATCKILAVNTESEPNNSSIVLRLTYGETSFLFTGDAEREVEQAILNRGETLQSTVLKVGHHGSKTSTSYVWLREIMPEYAVIPVGADNDYGHPTEEVLSRLRDAEVKTFRTDMQGDIVCVSDGKTVTVTPSRNANADVFEGLGGNGTAPGEAQILTLTEANALAAQQAHDTYTEKEYRVTGKITKIANTTYGNCTIADDSGVTFSIYGIYQGTIRYDALAVKPVVGDTITIQGKIGRYNRINQIKSGQLIAHIPAASVPEKPEAGDVTGDGKVDSGDGLRLLRYLNGWNVEILSVAALDISGDGKADSLDALLLMRYLNGWNVTLG